MSTRADRWLYGRPYREPLAESGYTLTSTWPDVDRGTVVLTDSDGRRQLWAHSQNFAGYAIVIEGKHYEFVRSLPTQENT